MLAFRLICVCLDWSVAGDARCMGVVGLIPAFERSLSRRSNNLCGVYEIQIIDDKEMTFDECSDGGREGFEKARH
jgi:hypothetical protein